MSEALGEGCDMQKMRYIGYTFELEQQFRRRRKPTYTARNGQFELWKRFSSRIFSEAVGIKKTGESSISINVDWMLGENNYLREVEESLFVSMISKIRCANMSS